MKTNPTKKNPDKFEKMCNKSVTAVHQTIKPAELTTDHFIFKLKPLSYLLPRRSAEFSWMEKRRDSQEAACVSVCSAPGMTSYPYNPLMRLAASGLESNRLHVMGLE